MPARAPAYRHAAFHGECADCLTCVFDHVAVSATYSDPADNCQNQVFRGDPARPFTVNPDQHRLRLELRQALRGQHVLHFARSYAESQSAKGAMGRSVTITADKGLPWLRKAQLRPDDVHDPLVAALHVKKHHAGFPAVPGQRLELRSGNGINQRQIAVLSGYGVVHDCERQVRSANLAAGGF